MKILPKIDIHIHAVPDRFIRQFNVGLATPDEIREMYDAHGIEGGVLLPEGPSPEGFMDTISLREAYNMVTTRPDVFAGWFCNFHPTMGKNSVDNDFSDYFQQMMEKGAKGVGEVTCNLYFDDPLVLNMFRHAEKCGLPVLFHIGNMGNDYGLVDEIGLPRLEKVLGLFPNLRFLGHSQKFWAHISGDVTVDEWNGYPKGPIVPGGRIVELMRRYPNLNCDLSAGSGYNAMSRDPDFTPGFLEEFQDRIFFGTDICSPINATSPMLNLSHLLDELMLSGKISYAAYEKISRKNALDLLGKNDTLN